MSYTIEEVKDAYNKLKTYIYYDSGELLLREKIVVFETDLPNNQHDFLKQYFNNDYSKYLTDNNDDFFKSPRKVGLDDKIKVITDRLNNYHTEPDFFNKYINEIDVVIFPKKFNSCIDENGIISNQRIKNEYSLEKATAFIDIPIEIHILSVLWILRSGVEIDSKLFSECVGNRLLLNKDKNKVAQGSSLFKPYFKQYQKWRDGAVDVAKKLLDNDKNVLFLNLDIKDYFYSVRIDKNVFPVNRDSNALNEYYNLNDILLKIHIRYTKKISEDFKLPYDFSDEILDEEGNINKLILPIGLLSSYVLANDYLKDFDKIIIEKFKPAYYGRYVDDILLVLSEPNPLSFKENSIYSDFVFSFEKYKEGINTKTNKFFNINFEEENLAVSELYILNNFSEIVSLVDNPFLENKEKNNSFKNIKNRIFKLNGYPSLFFQSQKTLLHFFDKDESNIVIDKLKKELLEKSSEFRDLPNEKNDSNNFEESAYYLEYDGTDGKIKTLKDYKEDRFGLSVYLSHKINFSLRNQKIIPESEQKKIINFFKGENCLALYKLWEKILTLFLVNNQPKNYIDFLFHCIEQIDKIEVKGKYSEKINTNLKDALVRHLFCSHEISLSLHLNFLDNDKKTSREYEFKSNDLKKNLYLMFFSNLDFIKPSSFIAHRYRKANMIRHHYVMVPLLNYTKESKKGRINLVDKKLNVDFYSLDEDLIKNSPRNLKFSECCIASTLQQFNKFGDEKNLTFDINGYVKTDILYNLKKIENEKIFNEEKEEWENRTTTININYLDSAFDIYMKGNENHSNNYDRIEEIKSKFYSQIDDKFEVDKMNKNFKPKISFANTEILEGNILSSVLGNPNLTVERYNQLADILSKARREKTDLLLFPECFIPFNLLNVLTRYSSDNQSAIVSGLEHITINKTSFNFVASILPLEVNGIKDAVVILRLKNNYSPEEEKLINSYHLNVPKPTNQNIQIINWRNIYFSVCYCFEMANISHREKLKSKIDLLIGIEWNRDVPYFSNIVESSSRDLHCYVAQVNTSNYGDTRLTQPKETALKDILRLKGGTNDVILVGEINIEKLRNFQRIKSSINISKEFKPLPPEFKMVEVMKRINNQ
jgi:hypothetical protein